MYLGTCIYGRIFRIISLSKYGVITRSPTFPEPRRGPPNEHRLVYQGIGLRLFYAAATAAAQEQEKNQQDPEQAVPTCQDQSNKPYLTPSLRFITFDHAQHDLGAETRETWETERHADQIASFLPFKPTSQAKAERLQTSSYGKHKADKLFVNQLLKDKGPHSQDWRIAFSDLLRYSTSEKINGSKGVDSFDYASSPVPIDGGEQISARRVISESRNYMSFRLARHISPPAEWSEANLAVYVEALAYSQRTQDRVPLAQRPRLKGWTNIEDIVSAFDTIFYSTTSQKFLTVKACNTALRFFYEYGMMTNARALYIRMEDLNMSISTETFNVLLRESAAQKDLHNFTFILKNITRRGFKPNEATWALFLRVIDSSKVRAIVVRTMSQMNMLDNFKVRRIVATHMIHDEIVNHLGQGHDHHSFLDHMNSKYGVGWLSTSAGNRLLNEVAKRQSASESLSLLCGMKQAGFMPDHISMRTLLGHCLPLRQHDLALEILAVFKNLYSLYPGPQVYEALFQHAWRSRLLNFSIVIWRTASIYGAVSGRMKSQVFRSLLSYTPALDKQVQLDHVADFSNLSRSAKFRMFAGRFVIGLDRAGGAALSRAVDSLKLGSQKRNRKWAQSLLEISLRISRTCLLKGDLSQKLREALTMDKSWAAEGLYKMADWREMFPRAITVQVKVNRLRPRRPLFRLRKRGDRGNSATDLLVRKMDLPRGVGRRKSPRLSLAVQIRMKNRRTKSLRTANLLAKRRQRIQPVRITSPSSTIRRRASTRQSSRSRLRLRPRKRKALLEA